MPHRTHDQRKLRKSKKLKKNFDYIRVAALCKRTTKEVIICLRANGTGTECFRRWHITKYMYVCDHDDDDGDG